MREVKTAFKRMAFYYFLLAVNIIPCASIIPDRFPTRNLSAIYLLLLCVCLVLYYAHRVTPSGKLSVMMKALSWASLSLILLRGIKYSAFAEVGTADRHVWYLYYVPMLLLPLFFFHISLLVAQPKGFRLKRWLWTAVITAVFIVLLLTNDLHRWVFRFQPQFENWDSVYTYGVLFYIITAWQYLLYLAAVAILVIKCRISSSKKGAWIILIPVTVGAVLNTLLVTGHMPKINGTHIFEFPETLIFTVAIVLECCMQLGLIPTNTDYGKLFRKFSIAAQITDKAGKPVYASNTALPLTADQFAADSGTRIGAHTLLHKMAIPGGYGFWQDDMTEIDRLNDQLAHAKEELAQETELIRLRNKLKENETKIEQRTLVYDTIAKRTERQSRLISLYAREGRESSDMRVKEDRKGKITLLGAYIKRYANLMLLSGQSESIEIGELALSVAEVLRYLNYYGIPAEVFSDAAGKVRAQAALSVFEAFETLLETNLSTLRGVFVNLSAEEQPLFKITLENMQTALPQTLTQTLRAAGVDSEISREDNVTYIRFTLPKGGGA